MHIRRLMFHGISAFLDLWGGIMPVVFPGAESGLAMPFSGSNFSVASL